MRNMTPSDERLIRPEDKELAYILQKIVLGFNDPRIPVLDIYKHEPWELPQLGLNTNDQEWCFICPRPGGRGSRLTESGYWKVTGRVHPIKDGKEEIGTKRFLVFYKGRTPNGVKTDWIMHQFSAPSNILSNQLQGTFVLCKILDKSINGVDILQNYIQDELGSNMIAYGAYGAYSGSNEFITCENQTSDAASPQQVDAELAPYPESFQGWNEYYASFDSASDASRAMPPVGI